MTSRSAPPNDTNRKVRWQFSLRELLVAMAVVSLYLSAYVVLLRGLATQQILLASGFASAILFGTLIGAFGATARKKHLAGDVIAELQRTPVSIYWIFLAVPLVIHIGALAGFFAAPVSAASRGPAGLDSWRMFGVLILIQSSFFSLWTWLNYPFKVCRNGLVHLMGAFTPWQKVSTWRWRLEPNGRLLIGKRKLRLVGIVLPADRDAVAMILGENMLPDGEA